MSYQRTCYLCGYPTECKDIARIYYLRCSVCNCHYHVDSSVRLNYLAREDVLDEADKRKILEHLRKSGGENADSEKSILISCEMIYAVTGKKSDYMISM
jgi:hypothetical protein